MLKRIHVPEKAIALSLGVSHKRMEKMMYLIESLQPGKVLVIEKAAEKFGVISKSIKRDLLLLEKKGWVIGSGTTSNRTYNFRNKLLSNSVLLEVNKNVPRMFQECSKNVPRMFQDVIIL